MVAIFATLLLLDNPLHVFLEDVLAWAAARGRWTALILAALWIPAAVLFVPGSILTLGTGFLLGLGWGTLVVSIGSIAGATAAFGVSRGLLRGWVRRQLGSRAAFRAIDRAVQNEGMTIVLLLRLSPLFPYNVLNYAFGATGVSGRSFILGSWLGMLPGTFLYVYLGSSARTLAEAATGGFEGGGWGRAFFFLGLLATLAATWMVTRIARRALARREDLAEVIDD
jgi:uncharacterized membrane protein YdjX (TVP38/TMEM64 family)